jgi:hypothetical protein
MTPLFGLLTIDLALFSQKSHRRLVLKPFMRHQPCEHVLVMWSTTCHLASSLDIYEGHMTSPSNSFDIKDPRLVLPMN